MKLVQWWTCHRHTPHTRTHCKLRLQWVPSTDTDTHTHCSHPSQRRRCPQTHTHTDIVKCRSSHQLHWRCLKNKTRQQTVFYFLFYQRQAASIHDNVRVCVCGHRLRWNGWEKAAFMCVCLWTPSPLRRVRAVCVWVAHSSLDELHLAVVYTTARCAYNSVPRCLLHMCVIFNIK